MSAFGSRFAHDFTHVPARRATEEARRGISGPGGPYPFRDQLQAAFGRRPLDSIRAHTDSRAAAAARSLGARAFTLGNDVAFDGPPDLETAAHEAVHAVERHPDVNLKPADSQGADPLAAEVARRMASCPDDQRTNYGCFGTDRYEEFGNGVDIRLTFDAGPTVDAKKIGLVQTVRSAVDGKAVPLHPSERGLMAGEGQRIDVAKGKEIGSSHRPVYANPIYGTGQVDTSKPPGQEKLGDTQMILAEEGKQGGGQWGCNYSVGGKLKHKKALLQDTPMLGGESQGRSQRFETAALAVEANTPKSNTYLGSVEWGWQLDQAGKAKKLPFAVVSKGVPSAGFMAAAKQWNRWETPGVIKTASQTKVYALWNSEEGYTVPKDTPVRIRSNGPTRQEVDILTMDGKETQKYGWIRTEDLYDAGGGTARATIPLPVEPKLKSRVELRSGPSSNAPVIATLDDTVRFKTLPMPSGISFGTIGSQYVEIELSAGQAGVRMMSAGGPMGTRPASLRGFIPRDSFE